MQGLNSSILKELVLVVPPLPEQIAIATFLGRETGKIDALVEEQKRLIDLLKEKRQSVISHAVTKGLNSDAPMKVSGVKWLGEVPEHWEVLPLRRISKQVQTGRTPTVELPSEELEGGLSWYTPGDFVGRLCLGAANKSITSESIRVGEANLFPAGSVLVVSIGATLGKVGLAVEASSANQQINAIEPNERVDGSFLAWSLSAKADVMRYLSNASTIGIMNQEKTKEIVVALPPLFEQHEITGYLSRVSATLDALMDKAETAISLLEERRAALISAAITGKIDVRGPDMGNDPSTPITKAREMVSA